MKMKASHKGFLWVAGAFVAGRASSYVDWTSKPAITFLCGMGAMILLLVAAMISAPSKKAPPKKDTGDG